MSVPSLNLVSHGAPALHKAGFKPHLNFEVNGPGDAASACRSELEVRLMTPAAVAAAADSDDPGNGRPGGLKPKFKGHRDSEPDACTATASGNCHRHGGCHWKDFWHLALASATGSGPW